MSNTEKYKKVCALVARGEMVKDACKKAGASQSLYFYRKKKEMARGGNSRVVEIPQTANGNVTMFYGTPEAIAAVQRSLQ